MINSTAGVKGAFKMTTKNEVVELICKSIADGRDIAGNWGEFPTDCFCHESSEHNRHFEFSAAFANGLADVAMNFAKTFKASK